MGGSNNFPSKLGHVGEWKGWYKMIMAGQQGWRQMYDFTFKKDLKTEMRDCKGKVQWLGLHFK